MDKITGMPASPKTGHKDNDSCAQDSWQSDQDSRGYYYDDAHGYEVYDPEDDDDEDPDQSEHEKGVVISDDPEK